MTEETPEVPSDYSPAESDDGQARDTLEAVTGGQDPDATEADEPATEDDAEPDDADDAEPDDAEA